MSPAHRRATRLRVTHQVPGAGTELVELRVLARAAGLRPQVASRLIALGLVEPAGGTAQRPLFAREAAGLLASAARLRRDLGLNYAGAALACELLARIEGLELQLDAAGLAVRERGDPDPAGARKPPRGGRRRPASPDAD
jgi:chaperone modulatory protein CbpM